MADGRILEAQRLAREDLGICDEESALVEEYIAERFGECCDACNDVLLDVAHDGIDDAGRMTYSFGWGCRNPDCGEYCEVTLTGYVHGDGTIEGLY